MDSTPTQSHTGTALISGNSLHTYKSKSPQWTLGLHSTLRTEVNAGRFGQTGWQGKPRDPLVFASSVLGLQMQCCTQCVYTGSWGSQAISGAHHQEFQWQALYQLSTPVFYKLSTYVPPMPIARTCELLILKVHSLSPFPLSYQSWCITLMINK